MVKPVLVIMAAGMGSRYGGLKQIDPIDPEGNLIIDFSIYDALEAGFEEAIFIIKRENEADFREAIGDRIRKYIKVRYVYQELDSLPEGVEVPAGRVKPFGTGHAILSCRDVVSGPFAVINADDYYGKNAFRSIYSYLCTHSDNEKYRFAMVGYILENTLTENGHVARGICRLDEQRRLVEITERTRIEKHDGQAVYTEDGGRSWIPLDNESIVSMNLWGFSRGILKELEERFPRFLEENLAKDPLKCEFFLPSVVSSLIQEGKAAVEVLRSQDRWYGVTYHEDKQRVMKAVEDMKGKGLYPRKLWR